MRDIDVSRIVRRAVLAVTPALVLACGASQDAASTSETTAAAPAEAAPAPAPAETSPAKGPDQVTSLYQLDARTIEGKDQPLSAYEGKVALVVNTASQCGYTPQYAGLEELWKKYKDKGLFVLGFPSNDFGGQEPGKDSEVLSFCQTRFGVTFPLFSKSVVKGSDASPVFKFLASGHGEPQWNFHKYLVDKQGRPVNAWPSAVAPDAPELTSAIEAQLAAQ